MPITCSEKQLASRLNSISNLLSPLTNTKIAASRYASTTTAIILGAHSGAKASAYTDGRFKTISQDIKGCYFEIWTTPNKSNWNLEKAYLQILKNEEELLALHCDPLTLTADKFYKYKCGPHIHVKHPTNEKISNAHISLNLANFTEVVGSIAEFEKAFHSAIEMIQHEFL